MDIIILASLFKLILLKNDLKHLNAPKCEDSGTWTYISKSTKTYQQKLEVNVNYFYFSAFNGYRYHTREARTWKDTVQHFAHYFIPFSSSLIILTVISLWLVVLELVSWRNLTRSASQLYSRKICSNCIIHYNLPTYV